MLRILPAYPTMAGPPSNQFGASTRKVPSLIARSRFTHDDSTPPRLGRFFYARFAPSELLNPRNNSPCNCQFSPVFAVASIIWPPHCLPLQTKIAFSTIRKTSVSRTVDMFGPFCPSQPYQIRQIRLSLRHLVRLPGYLRPFPARFAPSRSPSFPGEP